MSAPVPLALPSVGAAERAAVGEVLASGWLAQGPRVAAFEDALARVIDAPHVVATSSGTAALLLALRVAGVQPGDRVLVPSLTYIATVNAVVAAGAIPVFADVDARTLNLDVADAERAIAAEGPVAAVLLVHQLGHPAALGAFRALAKRTGTLLLEDAACALGSTIHGRPIGARAPGERGGAALSFHPRKVVTTGEGGALVTGSAAEADAARAFRDQGADRGAHERQRLGQREPEHYAAPGFNLRMSDLEAAVGLAQLGRLDAMLAARRRLAARYDELLAEVSGIMPFRFEPGIVPNRQSYAVVVDESIAPEGVCAALAERGIATRRAVMAAHLEPAYRAFATRPLETTEALARRALALPLFPDLTDTDQDRVVAALRAATRAR
ncbi:MAG: DegT/DnrJ/EryC1/StrS family aminotransferase [bacterium]